MYMQSCEMELKPIQIHYFEVEDLEITKPERINQHIQLLIVNLCNILFFILKIFKIVHFDNIKLSMF